MIQCNLNTMTNNLFTRSYSLLFILMLSITGCDTDTNTEENSIMNGNNSSQPLVFMVGEAPADFVQRMKNIGQAIGADRQPAGLNFYTIDSQQGARQTMRL